MKIAVGIPTAGEPVLEKRGDYTLLKNMLIGVGFHWERSIEVLLPGQVRLSGDSLFKVINTLPIEDYLECVVGSEMNPDAPEEFLKAHAVISRGWALGKVLQKHDDSSVGKISTRDTLVDWEDTADHTGFDVCSDDHCQRYQGVQPVPRAVLNSIRSTVRLILTAPDGAPVDTRFSKCCGGRTEIFSTCWQDREEQCLESVDCQWCDLSELAESERNAVLRSVLKDYDLLNNGGFRWNVEIGETEVRNNLKIKFGRDIGEILTMTPVRIGPSGRISLLRLEGSEGKIEIGKELMIRRLLSPSHLYSSAFELRPLLTGEGLRWKLEGKGWGHGVGLCQIGAADMARHGYNFEQILKFYYPGATLSSLPG